MTLQDAPVADNATPETADTSADQFAHLDLQVIVASLNNPRKTFDQAKLQELAESIAASGVHQPILVRPLPGSRLQDTFFEVGSLQPRTGPKPTHEIVAGERRYRASQMAGKPTIPAMIRHLTDKQVREIQIVENLQRADLSELEEAEGYHELMTLDGINADQVAEKIGKSRSYVYGRLKLMDLTAPAREALREGKIDASKALLLARIPDAKLQAKALKEFTATDYAGDNKLSYRAAKQWIEQNLMLKLGEAVFKITDAKLLPEAGSCKDCDKRTGANPDLFSDIDSPDVCTDPGCFHAKEKAHAVQVVEKAHKTGLTVIAGPDAEKVCFRHTNTQLREYTPVDERLDDPRIGGTAPAHQLLEEFFSKDEIKAATRLVVNPWTHQTVKVVTDELIVALDQKLTEKAATDPNVSEPQRAQANGIREEVERRRQNDLKKKFEQSWRDRVVEDLRPLLLKGAVKAFEPVVLRALMRALLADVYSLDHEAVALMLGDDPEADIEEDDFIDQIDKLPDDELGARICIFLAVTESNDVVDHVRVNGAMPEMVFTEPKVLTLLAEQASVDWKGLIAEVENEMREELGLPAATAPAALGKDSSENKGGKGGGKKPAKAAGGAGKKLSAEDAQSGIAAAMQSTEAAASTAASGDAAASQGGTVISPQAAWPFPRDAR